MTQTIRKISLLLVPCAMIAVLFLIDILPAHADVTNLAAVQVGARTRPGPLSCDGTPVDMWGNIAYAPSIDTGAWSPVAIKAPCWHFNINWGQQDYFDHMRINLANKVIPPETDIRFCSQEMVGGSYTTQSCTPWASAMTDNVWGDAGFPEPEDFTDIDGIRIKMQSRAMPGRSITNMQLRFSARGADWTGTKTSPWFETPWRSAGGGWSAPTMLSNYSIMDSVNVSMRVTLTPLPTAILTPKNFTQTGTLTVGQTLTFSGVIENSGTGASTVGTARLCIDNSSCATTSTGQFASPAIPVLAAGETSGSLGGSWVATLGSHTPYFCVVGGSCVSLASFTVVAAPPQDCTLDGVTVTNGSSRNFYNTSTVPFGESCDTGSSSGVPYAQSRTCNNGVLSGSASYNKATCITGAAPVQTDITLTPNTTLVRSGSSVLLTWDGGNATSCTLTGTNGFSSTAITGTNVSSGAITSRSTFKLVCTLAPNPPKEKTVSVSLIPNQTEQ